ncbi:thioredoxin domain-containing protein [Rhizobium sp. MHM7A]|uniref:thioredoxin domain-containing protein n=1 Tax=Rhizobium sp. MHM7A TaxID=2583233 RepID=UPI001106F8FC|nr:thioredoxin domain-containing protein [Rhizobium sp. MHM7A]TLX17047.1 DsbA family protein [Rhizobium sp. MHM7A]
MLRRKLLAVISSVSVLSVALASPAAAIQLGTPETAAPEAPKTVAFNPEVSYPSDIVTGSASAPVTIIEYASLTCPHCANFHTKVYNDLEKALIDTGKVRFVFRHFPLDQIAAVASTAVSCAPKESQAKVVSGLFTSLLSDKPWPNAGTFEVGAGAVFSHALGDAYDFEALKKCAENDEQFREAVKPRFDAESANVITGTPFFFINGQPYMGPRTVEEFSKAVDAAIAAKQAK